MSYVVNVWTGRRRPVARRGRTVHRASCRYARLPVRQFEIDAVEVLRLAMRALRGDGGGTRMCTVCRPDREAGALADVT